MHKPRGCVSCGVSYNPTGSTQRFCSDCGRVNLLNSRKMLAKNNRKRNEGSLKLLFYNRKSKAKLDGIPWKITLEDLIVPDVCPVLGTKFKYNSSHSLSIDKIDPSLGYVKGNVQVISRKANQMKSDATKEELIKFADWVYKNYKS